jgi:Ca2+-binding RTX toxin-like protein
LAGIGVTKGTAGSDALISTNPGQLILGLAGSDTLTAGAANQTLDGRSGNNTLNDGGVGVGGVTTIIGGPGNNTFIFNKATDVVMDMPNSGTNTARTTLADYTLPANVENLTFTGSGAVPGTGNGLNNVIRDGTTGSNTIDGVTGYNTLTGGPYSDTFVFKPHNPTAGKVGFGNDVITNFAASGVNHEVLQFAQSMFPPGTTAASLLAPPYAQQVGANVVITVDANDTFTLNNVLLTTFKANAAADIHFV